MAVKCQLNINGVYETWAYLWLLIFLHTSATFTQLIFKAFSRLFVHFYVCDAESKSHPNTENSLFKSEDF